MSYPLFPLPSLSQDAGSGLVVPAYIDGEFTSLSSNFDVVGPYTGKPVWSSAAASPSDATKAVEAAEAAFPSWSATKSSYRRDLLLRVARLMEERAGELAACMRTEMGADVFASEHFILPGGISLLKDIASRISSIQGAVPQLDAEGSSAMVLQVPIGVTVGICAWNGPFPFAARSIGSALAVGCTTIIKASEKTPRCYQLIAKCFHDAGLPKGVLNVISARPADAAAVTSALVEHKAVRKINFTGSSAIGREIAVMCARNLKPCLMELGGKNTALVLKDANLHTAAREVAIGGFANGGQICMSTDRVVVAKEVIEDFKKALTEVVAEMYKDKVLSQTLATEESKQRIQKVIQNAYEHGAHEIQGEWKDKTTQGSEGSDVTNGANGTGPAGTGVYFNPVIFERVTPEMTLWQDENFGPVIALAVAESDDEMVRMANSTSYGLSASVFSEDLRRALSLARQIEAGAVHINSMTVRDESCLPFGGVKETGWGRFNALKGLEEFLVTKNVTWVD